MVESTPAKLEDDDVGEAASLVRDTLRESDRGRNNSGSESSSDSENHDSDAPSGRRAKNLPTKKNTRLDGTRMEWSIAILYLACKWLRLPVMMADFHM